MRAIRNILFPQEIVKLLTTSSYLYFALSVVFSQTAFNMFNIVLIFLVYFLTGSNFAVSILIFVLLLPQILLSFIGGIYADMRNKKNILIFGNLARSLILILLFLNPHSLFLIYFVTFIVSVVTQFYVPAEAPLIPHLVNKKYLVAANSIFGIGLFGSILLGYVLAGPVINVLGRSNTFLILSLIFLFAGIFAALIPYKKKQVKDEKDIVLQEVKRSIREEFIESYRLLKKVNGVGSAFLLLIFSQVIVLTLATLVPGYAETILQVPAEDLSVLLFAPAAVGMIIAALFLATVFQKINKQKAMTIGVYLSGIALFLFPFMSRILSKGFIVFLNENFLPRILILDTLHFVLFLAFLAGAANALIFVPSQAIIQDKIPEDFRSKIYGLLFAAVGVFSLIPIVIAGGVADIFGVGTVFIVVGICIILLGISRTKFTFLK
jgi:MFS family permease